MAKGKAKKRTSWRYELQLNSAHGGGGGGGGSSFEPSSQPAAADSPLALELCALAPAVPRERVAELAAVHGDDMDTLVSRLLELSASLGAEGTQPSGSSEEEGDDTSFALLPSELLGPLLASLPLQALGSLALACKSTRVLVVRPPPDTNAAPRPPPEQPAAAALPQAQHFSSLRELRHERELKGWSNRRVLSLLRAARGLHSLSLCPRHVRDTSRR